MTRLLPPCLLALLVPLHAADSAPAKPAGPSWTDITHDLGGSTWGDGGISVVGVAPDTGDLVAGINGHGLWSSSSGGTSWEALTALPNPKGRPSCLVFDPTTTATFWCCVDEGTPALFATQDAGRTWKQLGNLSALASVAIDTSDPKHKTIIAGSQVRERDVEISTAGGSTFSRTYRLPADIGYTREVVLLDAKTMLVGSAGHDPKSHQDREGGIFRSDDGGKSWSKVSTSEPTGHAVVLKDGTILWASGDHEALQRSKDKGLTWSAVASARLAPMALDGTWLAAIGDSQLLLSSDEGVSWDPVGPPIPFQADGAVWDSKSRGFLVWHHTGGQEPGALMRLQAPDDFSLLVDPTLPRDLVAWDGDEKSGGQGWPDKPEGRLVKETTLARQGQGAMQWHVEQKVFFTNCGWVWGAYPLADKDAVDASADSKLVLSLKLVNLDKDPVPAGSTGPAPGLPSVLNLSVNALAGGAAVESKPPVELLKLFPKLLDGKWHDVAIPFSSLGDLNPKKLIGITLNANNGTNAFAFDLYIDNIGFSK